MVNERLRRVTDLFVEGAELFMGVEPTGEPIVIWVNKPNSFEAEEARRDGVAARGLRAAQLGPDSDEYAGLMTSIKGWSDQRLAEQRTEQMYDSLYIQAVNDIETDEKWVERLELVRRGAVILDDSGVGADDPRRKTITDANLEYLKAIRENQARIVDETIRDLLQKARKDVEEEYIEAWRNAISLDVFIAERRVTELFFALRDCKATVRGWETDEPEYDHTNCDHSIKLLQERAEVRALPETLVDRAVHKLDEISMDPRTAGNSDAPASSSASSELSSAVEDLSIPSIPEEVPSDALTS